MDKPYLLKKLTIPKEIAYDKHLLRQTEKESLVSTIILSIVAVAYYFTIQDTYDHFYYLISSLVFLNIFVILYQYFIVPTDRYGPNWANLETIVMSGVTISLLPLLGGFESPFFFVIYLVLVSTPISVLFRPFFLAILQIIALITVTWLSPGMHQTLIDETFRIIILLVSPLFIAFITTTTLFESLTQKKARDKAEDLAKLLAAEKAKLETVLDNTGDIVIATNKSGEIVLTNIKDKTIKVGDNINKKFPKLNIQTENKTQEVSIGNKGSLRVFRTTVKSLSGQNDEQIGKVIVMQDTSEEKNLEKMKIDFVSMATHELRTPLTSIRGYLSLLQNKDTKKKLNKEEREFLEQAAIGGLRLSQLVENLLAVARIENKYLTLKKEETDFVELVEKVFTELSHMAKSKGLKYEFVKPNEPLPKLIIDRIRLGEVVTNLINNAISYTNKGSVKVGFDQNENNVICMVSDTGQGIPKEALPNLFTKFFRVDGPLEADIPGTGLGLFISKKIVEGHKGKIWVRSEEGKGTTFYFSIPKSKKRSHKM